MVNLRLGQDANKGPHRTHRFTLINERRNCCDHGLGISHIGGLQVEEEPRTDPLHDAEVTNTASAQTQ
jgi:hypothetical protein